MIWKTGLGHDDLKTGLESRHDTRTLTPAARHCPQSLLMCFSDFSTSSSLTGAAVLAGMSSSNNNYF